MKFDSMSDTDFALDLAVRKETLRESGELWAKKSDGTCLFLFAVEKDEAGRSVYQQLEKVIG